MIAGRRRLRAVAAALLVLTAGCSGGAAGSTRSAAPSTLAGYYAQRLDWQPCDNGFECTRLLVPFDYSRPDGRRFSLPVVKLPASDPSRRIGALVINPGGPGGSGVQYALGARSELPAAVLARFDIIGFDPRGVGASEPALSCLTGPQLDQYLATDDAPANGAQLATVVGQSKLYAERCEQNSAALLPYVGTRNAARDMDVLRAALGESRLTYLGKSYGTYLGTWYAQLFPARVRALVLDGAVDPDTPSLQDDITQAEGFQVALSSFAAWCLATASCPLRGGSRGAGGAAAGAVAKVQGLVTRANSVPLANQLNDGQVADGAMLVNGVAAALYSKSYWPDLKTGADQRVRRGRHRARRTGQPAAGTEPQRDLQQPRRRRHRHQLPGPAVAALAGRVAGGRSTGGRAGSAVRPADRVGEPGLRVLAGPVLPAA